MEGQRLEFHPINSPCELSAQVSSNVYHCKPQVYNIIEAVLMCTHNLCFIKKFAGKNFKRDVATIN